MLFYLNHLMFHYIFKLLHCKTPKLTVLLVFNVWCHNWSAIECKQTTLVVLYIVWLITVRYQVTLSRNSRLWCLACFIFNLRLHERLLWLIRKITLLALQRKLVYFFIKWLLSIFVLIDHCLHFRISWWRNSVQVC